MERVKLASEKAGLYLNVGKTKVMTTEDQGEMVANGKSIFSIYSDRRRYIKVMETVISLQIIN